MAETGESFTEAQRKVEAKELYTVNVFAQGNNRVGEIVARSLTNALVKLVNEKYRSKDYRNQLIAWHQMDVSDETIRDYYVNGGENAMHAKLLEHGRRIVIENIYNYFEETDHSAELINGFFSRCDTLILCQGDYPLREPDPEEMKKERTNWVQIPDESYITVEIGTADTPGYAQRVDSLPDGSIRIDRTLIVPAIPEELLLLGEEDEATFNDKLLVYMDNERNQAIYRMCAEVILKYWLTK